ncbi:MAG: LTA synthase family protein [Firmicutes bacterium]|nr:LTA synthase family protein [Bacillota bacterium]
MRKIHLFFAKKKCLGAYQAAAFLAIFSALVAYAMLALGARNLPELHDLMRKSHFLMPLFNYLPVLLSALLLFCITGSAAVSASLVGFTGLFMALVNRAKIQLRGDPLIHHDLGLAQEALGIAKGFGIWRLLTAACFFALFAALAVVLCVKVKTRKLSLRPRMAGALGCALAMACGGVTLYRSQAVFDALPVAGSFYNLTNVHASKGNLYCFLYGLLTERAQKPPEGYGKRAVEQAIALLPAQTPNLPEKLPHIIMVMGEALSALSDSKALSLRHDPLETFHRLGAAGIEGTLIVPGRGGGTADTEFDVLTARVTRYLRNAPYAYRMIAGPTEALPTVLSGAGYQSFALHPGFRWFYNRQNVYRFLGFNEMVFEDAFPRDAYHGSFISEAATYDAFLRMLESRLQAHPGTPLFGFCLTIQNHAAYLNRFLPEGTYNFTADIPFADTQKNILSNYFEGITEADAQLNRLAEYLESLDDPAVLVCFGDHLPAIDESVYDALIPGVEAPDGSLLKETRLYQTPFLIWPNSAARGTIDIPSGTAVMPENMTISSNYLGAYLLELLGMSGLSPFFDYANAVRADFPILLESISYPRDGLPADEAALSRLALYRQWVYYRMMEK